VKHIVKIRSGIFVLLLLLATASAKAQTVNTLHSFTLADGAVPHAGLIMDASGNLYGTTITGGASSNCSGNGCGTVFELVSNSGTYAEKVLYSFTRSGGDGAFPWAGLVMDTSGNLYGTTLEGGSSTACSGNGCGTVFELVNNDGAYTENVLYTFTGSGGDGDSPSASLIMDKSGNLYGTTAAGGDPSACSGNGCGTVFELVNNGQSYSETVLHKFEGPGGGDGALPESGLVMDASGNLYGTTIEGGTSSSCEAEEGCGTVFELVYSNATYTEKLLYSFKGSGGDGSGPFAGLIMDTLGSLYGTTLGGGSFSNCQGGCGIVFELFNNRGSYLEKVLYSFTNLSPDGTDPYAGVVMDASGNLYGATPWGGSSSNCSGSGCGMVFELVNNSGAYTEKVLYSFTDVSPDGAVPEASLMMDASGNLYGTTVGGGSSSNCQGGCGTVFELTPASTPSNTPGLSANNTFTGGNTFTQPITGSITGNAGTVTNGVYTSGSYSDPSWITSLAGSKISGSVASALLAQQALALEFTPTQCGANQFSTGIAASGNANCLQPASSNLSDSSKLVFNAQANIFTGGKQTFPASALTYASLNLPNTGSAPTTPVMGDLWLTTADPHLFFFDKTSTAQRLAFLSDVSSAGGSLLSANNSFTGSNSFSQTITGSITGNAGTVTNGVYTTGAYSNPGWITALSGSKILGSVANATNAVNALTAGSATTATTATTAANASDLGGIVAGNYARLDVGNTFKGNQVVTGNVSVTGNSSTTGTVTIGSAGTPIKQHISVLVNPNFPALGPNTCATANITVTGASDGNPIALGIPNTRMNQGGNIIYTAWVSAANTVTIQACNVTAPARQKAPGSGSIRIDLWMY